MKSGTWWAAHLLAACLLLPCLGPSPDQAQTPQGGETGPIRLVVQVLGDDGASLAQQAFLILRSESNQAETWKTVRGKSEVVFEGLFPGSYSLEASAAGYDTSSASVVLASEFRVTRTTVILRRGIGSAWNARREIASASVVEPVIPSNARKETQRGIEDFHA